MRFSHCPVCGNKLILKTIGDEGETPYCENCGCPRFDMFSSCVITLVVNGDGKVALLKQNYISNQYRTLVSGYIKPGETAEEAAEREVGEELGITLSDLRLIRTICFDAGDTLLIAFIGHTNETAFTLSNEVDFAAWVSAEDAIHMVHPKTPGNASYFLIEKYLEETEDENLRN